MTVHRPEPIGLVRTKIVATLGPASRGPEAVRALIEAGVDVFRLNFSHATHDEHAGALATVRRCADECGRIVAVLQDLGGPKIRLGPIPGDAVDCRLDDEFTLVMDRTSDDPRQLTCTYRSLPGDLKIGDDVYFADGTVAMVVTAADGGSARLKVVLAGRIRSQQGINLPGANLNVQALTDKDLADLDWTASQPVDYVGLSFVRHASDVVRLRAELDTRGCEKVKIVAKIEKPQALDNLDAIIEQADAVMVARGDLGVEVDIARVPALQKRIITACRRARVPVITATQMLDSMETSSRPTRAEATDVFNAVLDGTDALMLSGETAIGAYPVESVETMSRIAAEAESLLLGASAAVDAHPAPSVKGRAGSVTPITEALVEAVPIVAQRLHARLVVVATNSGRTALVLSKQRYAPITLALASDPVIVRAMALDWGVIPLLAPDVVDVQASHAFALDWARRHGLIHAGDHLIVVRGTMPGHPAHNAMHVEVVA